MPLSIMPTTFLIEPLLTSQALSALIPAPLLLKPQRLPRPGSFGMY